MNWGEWQSTERDPDVGDYIQAEGISREGFSSGQRSRREGFVTTSSYYGFEISGNKDKFWLERWRKLKPPEIESQYPHKTQIKEPNHV